MKWDIWVQPNQIFTENYPDGWNSAEVERAANNRYGGKVTCVNPSGSCSTNAGGGSSSSSGGGGCGTLLLLGIGLAVFAMFGGGEGKDSSPSTPQQSYSAPVERVEPQFKDYATPPPSYCVTENFEPC